MTLREMILANRDRFYRQEWYWHEAFMDRHVPMDGSVTPSAPVGVAAQGMPPHLLTWELMDAVPAAGLAWDYLHTSDDPIWRQHYFWTDDLDHLGQRVFVGDNGHGLEIHRHIHISQKFGVPRWRQT